MDSRCIIPSEAPRFVVIKINTNVNISLGNRHFNASLPEEVL